MVVRMAGHRQLDHAFFIISQPKCIELVPIQAPQARAAATVTAVCCQSSYGMAVVAFRIKPRVPFSHQLLEFDLGRDELLAIDVPSHGCFLSRFAQSGAVHLQSGPGQ